MSRFKTSAERTQKKLDRDRRQAQILGRKIFGTNHIETPIPGYDWNPMEAYPPEYRCFCGSGVQAKICCIPKLPKCVPKEDCQKYEEYISYVKKRGEGPDPVTIVDPSKVVGTQVKK